VPESLPIGFRIARTPLLREAMRWILPRRAIDACSREEDHRCGA